MLHDDIGNSGNGVEAKELVEVRSANVEVDQCDATTAPGKGDCQIGNRRRLSFAPDGRSNHDDPSLLLEVHEFDVRPQLPEWLRVWTGRLGEHDELIRRPETPARAWDPREEWQTEGLLDLEETLAFAGLGAAA